MSPTPRLSDAVVSPAARRAPQLTGAEEERRQAFQTFVQSLPRRCSPSLIGDSVPLHSAVSPQSFDCNYKFDWSIDQMAVLHPAEFSNEFDPPFYQLDESVAGAIRNECSEFFSQSRVLPSPATDETNANDGFSAVFSPRSCSQSIEMLGTPSRGFGDMSVSEAKLPTPVNVTKAKQKKKKLFANESAVSEVLTEFSETESSSNSCADYFRSDSVTVLDQSMPTLSPIAGETSRVLEMGATDDMFSRDSRESESESLTTSMCSSGTAEMRSDQDYDRVSSIRCFAFKTSTPSQTRI